MGSVQANDNKGVSMKAAMSLVAVMAVVVVGGIIIGGCETTQSSDNVIVATPASVTLNASNLVVTFSVTPGTNASLVLPLDWSVTDPALGNITNSASLTATYQSNGSTGVNTVVVHDQALPRARLSSFNNRQV